MNSDPDATDPSKSGEMDALVAALRRDLPSERDSARLRARLSALGLAASEAFVSSAAAASTSLAQGAALGSAGEVALQAGSVSWALKASVVAAVSATAIVGPAWYVHDRASSAAPAASAAVVAAKAQGDTAAARQRRASDTQAEVPAAPSDREAATGMARDRAAPPRGAALGSGMAQTSPARETNGAPGEARVQSGASSTAGFADAADAKLGARAVEPTTLREETALIDRALSALRANDTQRATALLAEHERRFPSGLLSQERERAQRKLAEIRSAEGAR